MTIYVHISPLMMVPLLPLVYFRASVQLERRRRETIEGRIGKGKRFVLGPAIGLISKAYRQAPALDAGMSKMGFRNLFIETK